MVLGDVLRGSVNQGNIVAQQELEDRRFALSERQFGLSERQFGQKEAEFEATQATAAEAAFEESQKLFFKQLSEAVEATPSYKGSPGFNTSIETRRNTIERFREEGNLDPRFLDRMEQQLDLGALAPSPAQSGAAVGRGSQAELTAFLGREPTAEELASKAGVAPPNAVNIARLQQAREQAIAEGRPEDAAQIDAQIESLGASQTFDLRDPRAVLETGSKEDEAVRERLATGVSTLNSLTAALEDIQRVPEAVGPRGFFLEKFAGALDFVGLDVLADAIAGGDAAEAIAVRTGLRALTAKLLPILTGDTSGRYTDKEQQIAREIQNTNQLTASPRLSEAALGKLIAIEKEADIGEAAKLASRANLDLGTQKGMVRLLKALSDQGFTDDQAEEVARAVFIRGARAIVTQRESDGG